MTSSSTARCRAVPRPAARRASAARSDAEEGGGRRVVVRSTERPRSTSRSTTREEDRDVVVRRDERVVLVSGPHGEGRAVFENEDCKQRAEDQIALRYIDNHGNIAERYPENPNGSVDGICGLNSSDGRATIIMPHPERVSRTTQNSWHPEEWGEEGPWFYMFKNARRYLG